MLFVYELGLWLIIFEMALKEMHSTNQHRSALFYVLQQTSKLTKWLRCRGKQNVRVKCKSMSEYAKRAATNGYKHTNTFKQQCKYACTQKYNIHVLNTKISNYPIRLRWDSDQSEPSTMRFRPTDVHLVISQSVADEIELERLKSLRKLLHS